MKCPKCGVDNSSDARFCQHCGAAMEPDSGVASAPTPQAAAQVPSNGAGLPPAFRPRQTPQTRPLQAVGNPPPAPPEEGQDTVPMAGVTDGFAALPEGAILNRRYAVLEVRASNERHNAYLVEELAPVRRCDNCDTEVSDPDERFCSGCGADLSAVSESHRRYLVQERADAQAFDAEGRLLAMQLGHPGLLLPVAVFTEAPYGPARAYRVMPEFSPPLVRMVSLPQPLSSVLAWGVSLAEAMSHLHRHQVALNTVDVDHIAIGEKQALWTGLSGAAVVPPDQRAGAGAVFSADVQKLAAVLGYLATGRQRAAGEPDWPDSLTQLTARAQQLEGVTAATFADELRGILGTLQRPSSMSFLVGRRSDVGSVRALNEDSLYTLDIAVVRRSLSQPVGVFAVADGMGGHDAGDVASELTTRTVAELAAEGLVRSPGAEQVLQSPQDWLTTTVRRANQVVYEQRRLAKSDMGTTLVMALVVGATAAVANVGDSRCYHLSEKGIARITVDHSLVERLVAAGQITREEADDHPQRNVIYRVIGDKPNVEVDLYEQHLELGEALLLCSDGLSGMVPDAQIWQIWRAATSPQEACDRMVAAANEAGGDDNITAVIIQIGA